MITKLVLPHNFNFDDPIAKLVDVHSKGIDKEWMQKRAAMFDDLSVDIKPVKGKTFLHLITTGAGEIYGPNSNGDFFNKEAKEVIIPNPKRGGSSKIMLDGGLTKYHNTFMKTGHVYKHHQNNKDPKHASGMIKLEAYNPKMARGELIVELDNKKWEKEIQKIANEEPVYFSIGCTVPFDFCSECGNKASKRSEYCDDMKNNMLQMTKTANQIFAYNDRPGFHDISGVFRPADKIAFGLRKVASGGVISSADLAELSHYTVPTSFVDICLTGRKYDRMQVLKKLANIEEEIDGATDENPLGIAKYAFSVGSGFQDVPSVTLDRMHLNLDQSFSEMNRANIVLPMEGFFKLAMGDKYDQIEDKLASAKECMPGIFRSIYESNGLDEFLSDGTYDGQPCLLRNIKEEVSKLAETHSLASEPVAKRVTITMIRKEPGSSPSARTITKLSSEVDGTANFLAREYGKYLLSFCKDKEEDVQKLAMVQKTV